MTTLFHMNVEKTKKQPANLPLEAQAMAALKTPLPADAIALEVAELPGIVICHKGRALGLHLMARGTPMTVAQTNAVIALRGVGMRIETARGLDQALARVREMGVALKDDERHLFRDHYRRETRAGAKKGWSRLTVYEREFRRGSFVCKERCTDAAATQAEMRRALDRYEAAKAFDEGWQLCSVSWPGSGGFDAVRGGGGVPGAFVDHQRDVKDYWRRVEAAMGANDWLIIRRVCGENYSVAQAVSAISPAYKFSTLARFREALDALVGARTNGARRPGEVGHGRHSE